MGGRSQGPVGGQPGWSAQVFSKIWVYQGLWRIAIQLGNGHILLHCRGVGGSPPIYSTSFRPVKFRNKFVTILNFPGNPDFLPGKSGKGPALKHIPPFEKDEAGGG